MKKGCVGSSLAQYIIIMAVILGAILPLFFMVGGNINSVFSQYSSLFGEVASTTKNNLDFQKLYDLTDGDLNVKCTDSKCDLNFGDITIKGVPNDFSYVVETSGISSGTEVLVNILDQLASSVEDVSPEKSNGIKKLANMGHKIAQLEKQLSDYDCKMTSGVCQVSENSDLVAMNNEFTATLTDFNLQLAVVTSSISDNATLKAIIEQPSNEILNLGNTFSDVVDDNTHADIYTWKSAVKDYDKISTVTDIDSAIICASGSGEDAGYTCE